MPRKDRLRHSEVGPRPCGLLTGCRSYQASWARILADGDRARYWPRRCVKGLDLQAFFIFATILVPQIFMVWKFMPETAGRSLEEIEQTYYGAES